MVTKLGCFIYKLRLQKLFYFIKMVLASPFFNQTGIWIFIINKMAAITIQNPENLYSFEMFWTSLDRFIQKE
jgi:hypothetical protein